MRLTGAWCKGSTPAFGAVDLGSNPGAPASYFLILDSIAMTTKINPKIFRGFSIRGVIGKDFDIASMKEIGYAVGEWFGRHGAKRIVTGYDVRVTSPELHAMLCDGLVSSGLSIVDIGLVPTPILNFATDHFLADGGIMVTASHNPSEYNGLKIRADRTVFGNDLQEIYELTLSERIQRSHGVLTHEAPLDAYSHALSKRVSFQRSLRVVVDGGNGANGKVVPGLLRSFGHEVIEVFCEPDGSFPNRDPDPTAPHATDRLSSLVVLEKADLGLAFDGDGDRVILVDETGKRVLGDEILMLIAGNAISKGKADKIVYEVLCSHAVPDYILLKGGIPIPAPSGYAFVHNVMLQVDATIGGEMSGHFFLLDDVFRFDDAILAACEVLSILSSASVPLSTLTSSLPKYFASDEDRIECGKEHGDEYKTEIVNSVREYYASAGYSLEEIDGVSIDFGDAWALVRQSNTQPAVSLRFESKLSSDHMKGIRNMVLMLVAKEFEKRGIPWPENLVE